MSVSSCPIEDYCIFNAVLYVRAILSFLSDKLVSYFESVLQFGPCWLECCVSLIGKRRYNIKLWKTFTDCFNCLPIAAIIDEKIFCCHGGRETTAHSFFVCDKQLTEINSVVQSLHFAWLICHECVWQTGLSPDLSSMEQIRRVMRPTDVPDQGLLCDLLWSDPDKETMGWGENDRGVSFTFGAEVVAKFLHKHDLDLICRAHQVRICIDGVLLWCMTSREVLVYRGCWLNRLWRMVTNSLPSVSWSHCSRRPTTAGSLTTLVPWWVLTRLWCVPSRYSVSLEILAFY